MHLFELTCTVPLKSHDFGRIGKARCMVGHTDTFWYHFQMTSKDLMHNGHLLPQLGVDGLHLVQLHAQHTHTHGYDGSRGCPHLRLVVVVVQVVGGWESVKWLAVGWWRLVAVGCGA